MLAIATNYRAMQGTYTESFHLNLVQRSHAVNSNNTKTIGRDGEVVEKPLYKYIN